MDINGSPGTTFNGENKGEYHSWRASLEAELTGLEPMGADWLHLLSIRTTGAAKKLVKKALELGLGEPEETVEFIWYEFDEKFEVHPSAASVLLVRLQEFGEVSEKNRERLEEFKTICKQAVFLASKTGGAGLKALDEGEIHRKK